MSEFGFVMALESCKILLDFYTVCSQILKRAFVIDINGNSDDEDPYFEGREGTGQWSLEGDTIWIDGCVAREHFEPIFK